MLFLVVGTALLHVCSALEEAWQNTNALRTIDLTKSYVKESLAIIIENISQEPQDSYYVPLAQDVEYSVFEVREKGKSASTTAELGVSRDGAFWKIALSSPLAPKEKITLAFTTVMLQQLRPFPTKMEQNGKQYLAFSTKKLVPSLYKTLKEKTKIKFPNSDIPDASHAPERQGNTLVYGPFENDTPESSDIVKVRFEHTVPLPVVSYFERDIEISHWAGNAAFEDRYAVTNNAASLKGQFDRIAFAQSAFYNPQSAAIKSLIFPLPVGSKDAYFTDEIGNVSTSKFRSSAREANLEIKPRYPIFGNWNYTFTVGWNNDLNKFLTKSGRKHYLQVPFVEGSDDILYEDLRIRVILPEGAENVKVHCPVETTSETHGVHKTFMDTTGRRVVMLEARNLIDEKARQQMIVEYEYSSSALYRKPLVLISAIASAYLISALFARIV